MSAKRRYPPVKDGLWIQPVRRGYRMACCDCGLVHAIDFRISRGRVQIRPARDNRATAARRRAPALKRLGLITNARKLPR